MTSTNRKMECSGAVWKNWLLPIKTQWVWAPCDGKIQICQYFQKISHHLTRDASEGPSLLCVVKPSLAKCKSTRMWYYWSLCGSILFEKLNLRFLGRKHCINRNPPAIMTLLWKPLLSNYYFEYHWNRKFRTHIFKSRLEELCIDANFDGS